MKVVLQKVSKGKVTIDGIKKAEIKQGYVLLVGVKTGDEPADADYLAKKISRLRIFEDADDKMNLDIHEVGGSILSISQFTLLANTKKGKRPSFSKSAAPDVALSLYQYFNEQLRQENLTVLEGEFGEHMEVSLVNDGPVTIIFDTENK
ncbi:D-aminoacyl-tRNA deacylase [Vagococcus sp.]|uniref:D-aminoacyl-tRNA deacylase n=1 Tax=Vagococcus sp. TaxID=1933889 RepID=UPI003F953D7B